VGIAESSILKSLSQLRYVTKPIAVPGPRWSRLATPPWPVVRLWFDHGAVIWGSGEILPNRTTVAAHAQTHARFTA
jgi:hypothetical protein